MARKVALGFDKVIYANWEKGMSGEPFLVVEDDAAAFAIPGETVLVGVYRLEKVAKVKAPVFVE